MNCHLLWSADTFPARFYGRIPIVDGMAQLVRPECNQKFIRRLFTPVGHTDREMWAGVDIGTVLKQTFAGVKAVICENICH